MGQTTPQTFVVARSCCFGYAQCQRPKVSLLPIAHCIHPYQESLAKERVQDPWRRQGQRVLKSCSVASLRFFLQLELDFIWLVCLLPTLGNIVARLKSSVVRFRAHCVKVLLHVRQQSHRLFVVNLALIYLSFHMRSSVNKITDSNIIKFSIKTLRITHENQHVETVSTPTTEELTGGSWCRESLRLNVTVYIKAHNCTRLHKIFPVYLQ